MSDEHYLIATYFLTGCICVLIGLAAYLGLRRPLSEITDAPRPSLGTALRRFFPASTLLIAAAAFASVSYYSCGSHSYATIVSDRPYIRSMELAQIHETFLWLSVLVIFWGFVILMYLLAKRRHDVAGKARAGSASEKL
jgi:hypothetical protein